MPINKLLGEGSLRVSAIKTLRTYGPVITEELNSQLAGSPYESYRLEWPGDKAVFQRVDDLEGSQRTPVQFKFTSRVISRLTSGGLGCGNLLVELRCEILVTATKKRPGAVNPSDARGELQGLWQRVAEIAIGQYLMGSASGVYNLVRQNDPPDGRDRMANIDRTKNVIAWNVWLRYYDPFGVNTPPST